MKLALSAKHPLYKPLIILTASIIGLLVLSYTVIITSSQEFKQNTFVVKLISSQKSNCQRLINAIAEDNLGGRVSPIRVDSIMDNLILTEKSLQQTSIQSYIQHSEASLIPAFAALQNLFDTLNAGLELNLSGQGNTNDFLRLLSRQKSYTAQLDYLSTSLSSTSNSTVQGFQLKMVAILITFILLVYCEIRFIFIPAINKIESQTSTLTQISYNHSHVLRRPLANIQILLQLVDDCPQKQPEMQELLTLIKTETDELDEVLKGNILASNKENGIKINALKKDEVFKYSI